MGHKLIIQTSTILGEHIKIKYRIVLRRFLGEHNFDGIGIIVRNSLNFRGRH